jgi:hypothetical protein
MSDKHVVVAGFTDPVGAEIAKGRLESEGIPTFVAGGLTASTFSGMSSLAGRVELSVPAEQLARAIQILAECGGADHLTDEVRAEADDEEPVWVCPLCGEPVRAVLPLCPACHTPRGQVPAVNPQNDTEDEPEEGVQTQPSRGASLVRAQADQGLKKPNEIAPDRPWDHSEIDTADDSDIEDQSLRTIVGDSMARRAFYAALFSPLLAGFSVLYSIWLLIGLLFYSGELSARGMRHMYLALFLNSLILFIVFLLWAGSMRN